MIVPVASCIDGSHFKIVCNSLFNDRKTLLLDLRISMFVHHFNILASNHRHSKKDLSSNPCSEKPHNCLLEC